MIKQSLKFELVGFYFLMVVSIFASCKKGKESIFPDERPITQAVYASGKIFPINFYKVSSKIPGYIRQFHVNIGDTVKPGDQLVSIKNEVSEISVNTSRNIYEMAVENASEQGPLLTGLKQDYLSAKTKYELDSNNLVRFKNLKQQNATSQLQYDQAATSATVSKQTFIKAFNNYKNTKERLILEARNAELQYQAQVENKNEFDVLSLIHGTVFNINQKPGELTSFPSVLIEIGDPSKFEVELSVDEMDVALLIPNQKIFFTMDAFKDKIFEGMVSEIYPVISQVNKTAKIMATLDPKGEKNFYAGMSIEANIIIQEKASALVIPREYLTQETFVKPVDSDSLVRVVKGIEDLEFVEIVSGINKDTKLEKP